MRSTTSHQQPDDTAVRGMESAFVIVIFAGVGYLLDRWLGITPWLTVGLAVLGAVGVFASLKYRYEAAMARHEQQGRRT